MPTTLVSVPPADVDELIDVLRDAEEDDELVRAALHDPANAAYAAWHDGDMVGAAVVRWRPGLASEILYVAVVEKERGKGHGREILRHLVAELPAHGRRLVVGTANSSLDNIAFYQRCGFRVDAVRRGHFGYVQPEVTEFGIVMQDMIVFSFELPEQPTGAAAAIDEQADTEALDQVRLLLVPGSTRKESGNRAVLQTIASFTPHSVLFDGLADLPAFNPDEEAVVADTAVSSLRAQVAAADIVVFCSPEYAGTLPGSFKNLIDWTVGHGDLYRKPVVWINVAQPGRGGGATQALDLVLGYVDAHVLEPGGVRLPLPSSALGADGTIADPDYRARLRHAMAGIARAHLASPGVTS